MRERTAVDRARRLLLGFGVYLAETRAERRISLRELASRTGIRAERINRIEHATACPTEQEEDTLRAWLLGQHPDHTENGEHD